MSGRIDAHQHFWQIGRFAYSWMPGPPSPLCRDYLPADLAPILARNRFDGTVVVQATHDPGEVDWLLALADQYSLIRGVVGWVDLTDARVGETLDRLQRHPRFKGVRHIVHDEPDDEWLLRDDVLRGLRELESRNLPFDLLFFPRHLRLIPRLVDRVPRLRMVIDHIAKPPIASGGLHGWAEDMAQAAQYPRIFTKLSGMITEAGRDWTAAQLKAYVAHVMEVFGPARLMFGSDWPVCLLAGTWKEALAAFTQAIGPRSMEVREELLGGVATRFYALES